MDAHAYAHTCADDRRGRGRGPVGLHDLYMHTRRRRPANWPAARLDSYGGNVLSQELRQARVAGCGRRRKHVCLGVGLRTHITLWDPYGACPWCCYPHGCAAPARAPCRCNARGRRSKLKQGTPPRSTNVTRDSAYATITCVALLRTAAGRCVAARKSCRHQIIGRKLHRSGAHGGQRMQPLVQSVGHRPGGIAEHRG